MREIGFRETNKNRLHVALLITALGQKSRCWKRRIRYDSYRHASTAGDDREKPVAAAACIHYNIIIICKKSLLATRTRGAFLTVSFV